MAEKILKTKIALLYKTYAEWQAATAQAYVPLKGEVCFCSIPATTGVVAQEPCVLFKVGDGVKSFAQLEWASAKAADVYSWAKKANLDFSDLDATFLAALDERIAAKSENVEYQMVGANGVWKLQKREIGAAEWSDVSTVDVAAYVTPLLNKKVDKEIVGTNGKAVIFNEADGGGAKFEHTSGVESFVGVNDGGETGIAAQIYADKLVGGKWQGAKIDVTHGGVYYTVGDKSAAERDVEANEIATKGNVAEAVAVEKARAQAEEAKKVDKKVIGSKGTADMFNEADGGGSKFTGSNGVIAYVGTHDNIGGEIGTQIYVDKAGGAESTIIDVTQNGAYYTKGAILPGSQRCVAENEIVTKKDLAGGLHYIGKTTLGAGETYEQAIARLLAEKGHTAASGDIVIVEDTEGAKEFIFDGAKWQEIGSEGVFATKAALAQEVAAREAAVSAEATTRAAEDAKKVDKEIVGTNGKAKIFNEADGGGAKFEHNDGLESFIGVNDGGKNGLAAQIYADEFVDGKWTGAKIDVTKGGIYYTVGNKSAAERDVAANEIATKGNVDSAVAVEKARAQAEEAKKLETYNVTVNGAAGQYKGEANVPVYFEVEPSAEKITVKSHYISLNTTKEQVAQVNSLDIGAATTSNIGLMTAADKVRVNKAVQEDDTLVLNCNGAD